MVDNKIKLFRNGQLFQSFVSLRPNVYTVLLLKGTRFLFELQEPKIPGHEIVWNTFIGEIKETF